jgi:hypothetical protein
VTADEARLAESGDDRAGTAVLDGCRHAVEVAQACAELVDLRIGVVLS